MTISAGHLSEQLHCLFRSTQQIFLAATGRIVIGALRARLIWVILVQMGVTRELIQETIPATILGPVTVLTLMMIAVQMMIMNLSS